MNTPLHYADRTLGNAPWDFPAAGELARVAGLQPCRFVYSNTATVVLGRKASNLVEADVIALGQALAKAPKAVTHVVFDDETPDFILGIDNPNLDRNIERTAKWFKWLQRGYPGVKVSSWANCPPMSGRANVTPAEYSAYLIRCLPVTAACDFQITDSYWYSDRAGWLATIKSQRATTLDMTLPWFATVSPINMTTNKPLSFDDVRWMSRTLKQAGADGVIWWAGMADYTDISGEMLLVIEEAAK